MGEEEEVEADLLAVVVGDAVQGHVPGPGPVDEPLGLDLLELAPVVEPARKSTAGSGRPDRTSKLSRHSKSIWLIFGRIDGSRRVLEARPKRRVRTVR